MGDMGRMDFEGITEISLDLPCQCMASEISLALRPGPALHRPSHHGYVLDDAGRHAGGPQSAFGRRTQAGDDRLVLIHPQLLSTARMPSVVGREADTRHRTWHLRDRARH